NKMIGNRAVTARGTTSYIHQIAIHPATPAILLIKGASGSKSNKKTKKIQNSGPLKNFNNLFNYLPLLDQSLRIHAGR
ncbi:hypothetical protein ACFL3L_01985, partial [Candidatus Neomarinimicrobiota bacterium]